MRISDWSSDVCSSDLTISPACRLPRPQILGACRSSTALRPQAVLAPGRRLSDRRQGRDGRDLANGRINTMSTIGTFSKSEKGNTGTVRTLTVNVKVNFVPNAKTSDTGPKYPMLAR